MRHIGEIMARICTAVAPFRSAAIFELAGDAATSLFEMLAANIISLRPYDKEAVPMARRLFGRARTLSAMAKPTVG